MRAQSCLRPRSRFANWQPLTATELEGFVAITLNMGIIQIPEIEDYWKTSWSSEVLFFTSVMRRDRFEQIFWLLHTSHVEEGQPERRIDKVKSLLNVLPYTGSDMLQEASTQYGDLPQPARIVLHVTELYPEQGSSCVY